MSLPDPQAQTIPFVYTAPGSPVHDLVAAVRDEASDEMSRSIWQEFRHELIERLKFLDETPPESEELVKELHSLRGLSSQFGLFLLETFLFAWEKKEQDPAKASARYLPGSLAIAHLSLEAIEKDFPHLKSPAH